jgi:hypothetical protein
MSALSQMLAIDSDPKRSSYEEKTKHPDFTSAKGWQQLAHPVGFFIQQTTGKNTYNNAQNIPCPFCQ